MNPSQKYFYDEYLKKRERPYNPSIGKDGALFKRLEGYYGRENVQTMIDAYLALDNEFARNSGYSVGVFWHMVNQLLDLCDIHTRRAPEPKLKQGNFTFHQKPRGFVSVADILQGLKKQ